MAAAPTDEAIKTYRYVRLAMVVLVVGIAVAMLREHAASQGWLSSISAYYYTPARGMFTAALVGIGVCLICLRGPSPGEDMLLNAAGMLAPIVAIVPTPPGKADCVRIFDAFVKTYEIRLANPVPDESKCTHVLSERTDAVSNNFPSLLIIGVIGFALLVLLVIWRRTRGLADVLHRWDVVGFAITAALAVGVSWVYVDDETHKWFMAHMHFVAAGTMFLLIAACSILDGYKVFQNLNRPVQGIAFISIGVLLAAGSGVLLKIGWANHWNQTVLWAELWGISWFAFFWVGQTADLWDTTTRDKSPAAQAAAAAAPPTHAGTGNTITGRLKTFFAM